MLKKNDKSPILWTDSAIAAFEKYKVDLQKATLLGHLDPEAQISLYYDVSDDVVEAVLDKRLNAT